MVLVVIYDDQIDQNYLIFKIKERNLSYKAGFDWFINDKTALTIYTNQWDGDHAVFDQIQMFYKTKILIN